METSVKSGSLRRHVTQLCTSLSCRTSTYMECIIVQLYYAYGLTTGFYPKFIYINSEKCAGR